MNMTDKLENKITSHTCEFCNRQFVRASTHEKHVCEPKRRWSDRDRVANRLAYGAWKHYFQTYHANKKKIEYLDFIKNNYYTAFVRFGTYCVETRVINPLAYSIYLVKNRVPIDNWNTDRSYTQYLIDYLRIEDSMGAVQRSVETLLEISAAENIQLSDTFRYINANKLCFMITTGQISPWLLYQSQSGQEFLAKLNSDQTNLIFEYINPEKWKIKFLRDAESVEQVRSVISRIPL